MKLNLEGALEVLRDSDSICGDVKEDTEKILRVLCGKKLEEEIYYGIGDRFEEKEFGEYILAVTGYNRVLLVSLIRGSRWGNPKEVGNTNRVTKKEFDEMVGDGSFKLIKK